MTEKILLKIGFYIYRNNSNQYSVIKTNDGLTAVGKLPEYSEGTKILAEGKWTNHTKYGQQFNIENYELIEINNTANIKTFLASELFYGMGYKTVVKIVDKFKEKSLDILLNFPEELKTISGIGNQRYAKIWASIEENNSLIELASFLLPLGLNAKHVQKIYKLFENEAQEEIQRNPYKLIGNIWGINFKKADDIAKQLGYCPFGDERIKAALLYLISNFSNNGHCYINRSTLLNYCQSLLEIEIDFIESNLSLLEEIGAIVLDSGKVYSSEIYLAERGIEEIINKFLIPPRELQEYETILLKMYKNQYSSEQINAIEESLKNKLLIITGGPGTGKTRTIKGVTAIFKKLGKKILLTAPTGRAAKRMEELIGEEAKTIHRLLEYNPFDDCFNISEENKLQTDVLVVDEVSMIDILLMYNLLAAVEDETTIILVGDSEQLPSVGPGNVLHDLIKADIISTVHLKEIFRQSSESKILIVAHDIRNGEPPDINFKEDSDLYFIDEPDDRLTSKKIVELASHLIPEQYGFDPFKDIQILSPMYKGELGIDNLNKLIQTELNEKETLFNRGSFEFRLNDKVLQLKNNYGKNIYNGDIGYIHSADMHNKKINISFNDSIVNYNLDEIEELKLAYCISIHKSQGSEFPCVILPITAAHKNMLRRNLLYTAITRAQKLLILIGSKNTFYQAIRNNNESERLTTLFQ